MQYQPTPTERAPAATNDLFAQIDLRHSLCRLAELMQRDMTTQRLSPVPPAKPKAGGHPVLPRSMCRPTRWMAVDGRLRSLLRPVELNHQHKSF